MSGHETIRALWETWQQDGYQAAIRRHMTADGVWDMRRSGVPRASEHRGHEATARYFRQWEGGFENWKVDLREIHDLGPTLVIGEWRQSGRLRGVDVAMTFWILYELRGNLVQRATVYTEPVDAWRDAETKRQGSGTNLET